MEQRMTGATIRPLRAVLLFVWSVVGFRRLEFGNVHHSGPPTDWSTCSLQCATPQHKPIKQYLHMLHNHQMVTPETAVFIRIPESLPPVTLGQFLRGDTHDRAFLLSQEKKRGAMRPFP